jgi:hypothetical protein
LRLSVVSYLVGRRRQCLEMVHVEEGTSVRLRSCLRER